MLIVLLGCFVHTGSLCFVYILMCFVDCSIRVFCNIHFL